VPLLAVSGGGLASARHGLNAPPDCHTIDINEWLLADISVWHSSITLIIQ